MQEDWKNDRKFVATFILTIPGVIALIFAVPDEFRFAMSAIVTIAFIFTFAVLFDKVIFSALSKSRKSFKKLSAGIVSLDGKKRRQRIMATLLIVNACVAFAFFSMVTIASGGNFDTQVSFNPILSSIGISSMFIMLMLSMYFKLVQFIISCRNALTRLKNILNSITINKKEN
jgi:hypothetical protein